MERAEEAIFELRSRRGREQLTFDELADHLHNFWELHRGRGDLLAELALSLAEARRGPHEGDGREKEEELLDLGSELSFPASDPPSSSVPGW